MIFLDEVHSFEVMNRSVLLTCTWKGDVKGFKMYLDLPKSRRKEDGIKVHFGGSINAILFVNSHKLRHCIVNRKEIRELFTLEDFHCSNAGFIYDSSQRKVCIKPRVKQALIVLEYSVGQRQE